MRYDIMIFKYLMYNRTLATSQLILPRNIRKVIQLCPSAAQTYLRSSVLYTWYTTALLSLCAVYIA